jgi:hypothetical protein
MKWTYLNLLFVFQCLTLTTVNGQTVTRPGGGGELDISSVSISRIFLKLSHEFDLQIKRCDPSYKKGTSFDDIYEYLHFKHFEHMLDTQKRFKDPNPDSCPGHGGKSLHCILSSRIKVEIKKLIKEPDFKRYLLDNLKLSHDEAEARIFFLEHLCEKQNGD